jgi:hypothetical protein
MTNRTSDKFSTWNADSLDYHGGDTMPLPEENVNDLALKHQKLRTWRDRRQGYWYWRLWLEFIELGFALCALHRHSPDWELEQIASICINWLDKRIEDAHSF